MMVTFVSQCEKKALHKTRRVLDAFANRIGDHTWQTAITQEGLQAVRKLLRKTASKNTAVSCHWARSRNRSELVWIVGNRHKFNAQGSVPVNTTKQTMINTQWENDWHYLPLIKALAGLAALFHDWGKASEFFQAKLKPKSKSKKTKIIGDPLRHEWISALFLNAYVNHEADEQWLTRLANGDIVAHDLITRVGETQHKKGHKNNPLAYPPNANAASLLAWLVVSHHRLPDDKSDKKESYRGQSVDQFGVLLGLIKQTWGYQNKYDESEFKDNLTRCLNYPKGFPSQSTQWLQYTQKQAKKMLDCLPLLAQSIADGSWRLILHHARLSLMLGDHYFSSKEIDPAWHSELDLYANTDRETGKLKQKLDEHLLGVAKQAVHTAHLLPAFEGKHDALQHVYDVKALRQKNRGKYRWQDIAVTKINAWRKQHEGNLDASHFGFFAVNMASTGEGKTFANAKIMRALSLEGESLRYILALGLRTLTLQTGDEYRGRIGLEKDELAVLVGSRAVIDLHNNKQQEKQEQRLGVSGSESEAVLLDNDLDFETTIPEGGLKTVLKTHKDRAFLFAPVLSCTIDHLMAATETTRGGRYILPSLRLMSSDLVIDEIDDFDGKDLIAIGRLIHFAGMLGRKVMISSATIPPDLAEGYYNTYQAGWAIFARMRQRSPMVGCAWVDEFTTVIHSIVAVESDDRIADYQRHHQHFVADKIKKLKKQVVKRKANIVPCQVPEDQTDTVRASFYAAIQQAIVEKHHQQCVVDALSGKRVSFGVVRVANISTCVELTRYLLKAVWPENIDIRAMAYHSQQLLIMRNEQEKHLDAVLKRNKGSQAAFQQAVIQQHLHTSGAQHVIFMLVATPVEEVGRDHDFDWAVVEPSSYRSLIQLAGRILRHRELDGSLESPNMALLQYNLKGLLSGGKEAVFCKPGYESSEHRLHSHDLTQLVDVSALSQCLDAQPRISKPSTMQPKTNLAHLEHECIHQLLTRYDSQGPETLQGWLQGVWWLSAMPQQYVRFRDSSPQILFYLVPADGAWKFVEKLPFGKIADREVQYGITHDELDAESCQRLWLHRDYETLLEAFGSSNLQDTALVYGEMGVQTYGEDPNNLSFTYSSQLGLVRNQ